MVSRARQLASWLVFPVILGGTFAAALALMPALGTPAAVAVVVVASVLAIAGAERLLPHRAEWGRSHGDVGTDVTHAFVSGIATTRLAELVVRLGGAVVAVRLTELLGASAWPTTWPLLAQLGLALLLAELPQYWFHRLEHEQEWLWRFHAVHHSAPRLYWLNAARFHPVDLGLLYLLGYAPLIVLGCPEQVIALYALFDAVFGMLQHCNIDTQLGPLNRIFSAAEPHRWHHSRTLDEANSNYGSNLIVWDLLFGTFFLPRDREPPAEIGIAALPAFPAGYLAQLASPFRWRRVKREAALAGV
jgi:sterol desaturase/sphingolipid hydroxylase (fatty acid hydroxylase superfamily)